jgi:hypothetical protein
LERTKNQLATFEQIETGPIQRFNNDLAAPYATISSTTARNGSMSKGLVR